MPTSDASRITDDDKRRALFAEFGFDARAVAVEVFRLRAEVAALTAQRDAALALLDEYAARGDFKWGVMHLRSALGASPVAADPPEPKRDAGCVARWPECADGKYDPHCCRFPKPCSAEARRSLHREG